MKHSFSAGSAISGCKHSRGACLLAAFFALVLLSGIAHAGTCTNPRTALEHGTSVQGCC